MSGEVEVFLDVMPGETRGVVARDGRYLHLLIARETDAPQTRLGARSVGRVLSVDQGLKGAFVDLGAEGPPAFLPLKKAETVREGDRIEVVVTAEPREAKGPVVGKVGEGPEAGRGAPRLIVAGPSVAEQLAALAPGVVVQEGVAAIRASQEAEEEALAPTHLFPAHGLDLAVERTRALIAVDIDHRAQAGRDAKKARSQANPLALREAARLIRLKRWGGLVAVDLIGAGHDANAIMAAAKTAFGDDPEVVFGPLNRFGVLSLSLPWGRTPIEDVLHARRKGPTVETGALALLRRLRLALLSDTATPRYRIRCCAAEAAIAQPLAERLGPRASVLADMTMRPGAGVIEEG